MDVVSLIISLISGVAGGNLAGASMPNKSLGGVGNSIAGLIGGGAGDFILRALGVLGATATTATTGDTTASDTMSNAVSATNGLDLSSVLASILSGGVSGGVLTGIVALIKDALQKK